MDSRGAVNVLDAIERLGADTIRERTNGLQKLKAIFTHGTDQLDGIDDESLHQILEHLFKFVRAEKKSYLRANKPTTKNTISLRLATGASALRTIVDAVNFKFAERTVNALLDHIIDILSASDSVFFEPVDADYLKCFKTVLQHQSHAEHLRPKQWLTYLDFVLDSLDRLLSEGSDDAISTQSFQAGGGSRAGQSMAIRGSQVSTSHANNSSSSSRLDDIVQILRELTCTTNAPIPDRLTQICQTLIVALSTISRPTSLVTAFESMNNVLPIVLTEDVRLATRVFSELCGPIQRLWSDKLPALRVEMLVSLFYLRHIYLNPVVVESSVDLALIDLLVGVIWSELEKKPERDLLQLDAASFVEYKVTPTLSLVGISPADDHERVTASWSNLYILSLLLIGLNNARHLPKQADEMDQSNKRRKREHSYGDVFWRIQNTTSSPRIVALQVALFIAEQLNSQEMFLEENITKLEPLLNEDDPLASCWTMVLLARLSQFKNLKSSGFHDFWRRVWSAGAAATTNSFTSRYGCYLMQMMVRSGLVRTCLTPQIVSESIFTDGNSGPAVLSDAALNLLTAVLRFSVFDNERAFRHFASRSLNWLEARWIIPTVPDRMHNAQTATYGQPVLIADLLHAIVGKQMMLEKQEARIFAGSIYKAASIDERDLPITKFMSMEEHNNQANSTAPSSIAVKSHALPPHAYLPPEAISEFLSLKLKSFNSAWLSLSSERIADVNTDIASIAATVCSLSGLVSSWNESLGSTLEFTTLELWKTVCESCSRRSLKSFQAFAVKISSCLLQLRCSDTNTRHDISAARKQLVTSMLDTMKRGPESQDIAMLDFEFMDSFDGSMSQPNQVRQPRYVYNGTRSDIPQAIDGRCQFLINNLYLHLDVLFASGIGTLDASTTAKFLREILSLDDLALFSARSVIQYILSEEISIKRSDALHLVSRIGRICLEQDEFERSEAALCLCLEVLTKFTDLWASNEDDELANSAFEIYQWYLNVALGRGKASGRVLQQMTILLEKLLIINPAYAHGDLSSPRTVLLQILQKCSAGLKFQLAPQLSRLFEGYVLSEHTAIFDDIVENLPADPDNREGIAARLHILAYLGARWHTVLREAIYHIFETAANVPHVMGFAKQCVHTVCNFLEIEDVKSLFRLFSSQIFYTWLEQKETINKIPAEAFGYHDLKALLQDNKDELTAQLVMRASSATVEEVVQYLGYPWSELIETSFARVIAYAVIADVSHHRVAGNTGPSEEFLLSTLGEERFMTLLSEHFAEALSIILLRLTDDKGFEKSLETHKDFEGMAERYSEMCTLSSSETQLPPGQQPSFRAKYLLPILKRLSSRIGLPREQLWSPPVLLYALRTLLDDTDPALGPLHACATVRKLRVVLTLSGSVGIEKYPLEMLLHGIRPYITSFHSSADALGMIWYLLQHGRTYLQSRPEFVAGLGVTMFASLLGFVNSSQDSTTQELHFQTTISNANKFRKWLGVYLDELYADTTTTVMKTEFYNITNSAKQLTISGSNNRTSSEGSLLYYLIMDQAAENPLLTKAFFHYTLQVLCKDFVIVQDPVDDILAGDDDLEQAVPILWNILHHSKPSKEFQLWLGQSLGRASLLLGPEATSLFATNLESGAVQDNPHLQAIDSYSHIVSALIDHLWGGNREYASAAEYTLQSIFSSIPIPHKSHYLNTTESEGLFQQLRFGDLTCPPPSNNFHRVSSTQKHDNPELDAWATEIADQVCQQYPHDPVLIHLRNVISVISSLSSDVLPMIIHLALLADATDRTTVRDLVASRFSKVMKVDQQFSKQQASLALKVIIYLRRCSLPSEVTMAQRNTWLPIDFKVVAMAALKCESYHESLLMLEIHASQHALAGGRSSKRSSIGDSTVPRDLMAEIFCSIDDPDFFYGTQQDAEFASIVNKLFHEGDGKKALSFQSALFDAGVRNSGLDDAAKKDSTAIVSALTMANFRAMANIVGQNSDSDAARSGSSSYNSLNLEQWSINNDKSTSLDSDSIPSIFHILGSAARVRPMLSATKQVIQTTTEIARSQMHRPSSLAKLCISLATLAEITQALSSTNYEDMPDTLAHRLRGKKWVEHERFGHIESLLLAREAFASVLKTNTSLQAELKLTPQRALLLEIQLLRSSLSIGRAHDMLQFSLNRAAYMSDLIQPAKDIGLKTDVAIGYDMASTFWSQNETSASIKLLQSLRSRKDLKDQAIAISKSEVLTDLGQKLTQARLDRADEITSQYLRPAIAALDKSVDGSTAGRVYHNFAVFCDQQLRDPDNLDEYQRVEKLRNRKKDEVLELERIKKGKEGKARDQVRGHLAKAQTWFKLDEQEWRRLKAHREGLISDCLENYLKSMRSCDDFPNDVLRFLALWLEQSQNADANATVDKYLRLVQSYKFAPLMNQLSSRILDEDDIFQKILFELMFRICNDHPHHSLYQVFATSKSKGQKNDTVATSRHQAATKLSKDVVETGSAKSLWVSIHNTCIAYFRLAQEKSGDREVKAGSKIQLRKMAMGAKLEQAILDSHQKVPPPTMDIPLRPDCDYSSIPKLASLDPYMTIAGGISAPKIVTAVATDGSLHKMLLKGGNDDLRQDSIMEQVFKQVSDLLKDNRATRQRNLGIRTYKVIPLMSNAGIIEFVRNTIPLHDFILPAHGRYYPRDYKPSRCRKEIGDAQTKPLSQRLQAYSNVTSNFHPVMRFFFMEHFLDPDDWFQKRLNYSRSTAAISMLGHVLGIGDRHGHNILLDKKTGEVVHIDLGVAFEAGRVLPVPEVVPFRLTRDIVDGMGISGVEGVFRRCCIFTLEALRQDQEAIMTILDVLRYDPLYSWSISPIRLQRMQDNQEQAANAAAAASMVSSSMDPRGTPAPTSSGDQTPVEVVPTKQSEINEPGEADRALAVVARKLGKSLSVEATVNDLIRQAMDERNLAVLYCGWAAYA